MNVIAFVFFIFALQVICLFVGGKASKGLSTQDDYFLAGKGVTFFPLMMTFVATQVGGGLVLGSAEEAYQYGWTVLFYPLGAALGLMLLGLGVGKKLASFKVSTVAQIFEAYYSSPILKKVASLLSIITLFMIFIAQIVGSSKFMVSMGVDSTFWFILFWTIVICYTAVGGMKAVVATDIIQALFFVGVFLFGFGFVFMNFDPSLAIFSQNISNGGFAFDMNKLYGWLLMPLMFMVIEQDMGQRCFAAESPNAIKKATLSAAAITLLMGFIPVFLGILAQKLSLTPPPGGSVLMFVLEKTTTPWIAALVGSAILAAIISTADSLINAIGSNLSQDFTVFKTKSVRFSQYVSAGISFAGIYCSFYVTNIVDLLMLSYELSVSALFVPIVMALIMKNGKKSAAFMSILMGTLGFLYFKVFPTNIILPKEIIIMMVSFLGFYAGQLMKANESVVASD